MTYEVKLNLSPTDLAIVDYIVKNANAEEFINTIIANFAIKSPDNIPKLSEFVKTLHDLQVKILVEEGRRQKHALEYLSHFCDENKWGDKSIIGMHWTVMILFPDPLNWEKFHSIATKNFFLKFMKLYPEFRYDPKDTWFKDFSNPEWWEKVEELYLRDFEK